MGYSGGLLGPPVIGFIAHNLGNAACDDFHRHPERPPYGIAAANADSLE